MAILRFLFAKVLVYYSSILFTHSSELLKKGKVFFYSFDFAKTAVDLVMSHPEYDSSLCRAFVCDVVKEDIPNFVPIGSINVVIMIFVLSAISPEHFPSVIEKLYQVSILFKVLLLVFYIY